MPWIRKKKEKEKEIVLRGMKKTTRNWDMKIRLSKWEKDRIKDKANTIGLRPSSYVRVMALHGLSVPEMIVL